MSDLIKRHQPLISYDSLRSLHRFYPDDYEELSRNIDILIVDEAQFADKSTSFRSQAIYNLKANYKWLLSATPYQSDPKRIWNLLNFIDPKKFSDQKIFNQVYLNSPGGLSRLHLDMSNYISRTRKKDVLNYFEDPTVNSFKDQLLAGPRIAKQIQLPSLEYELSYEQSKLISFILNDFKNFSIWYNNFKDEEIIDLDKINSLQIFHYANMVIYNPANFGLEFPQSFFEKLDGQIESSLSNNQKIILWGFNLNLIKMLTNRYREMGALSYFGETQNQEEVISQFQNNPRIKILVASYKAGGVGLTLTAATKSIFIQLPDNYPAYYQIKGRNHRVIGLNNIRHAKKEVLTQHFVPKYNPRFLEDIYDNKNLYQALQHGTIVEQTVTRLEKGEKLYDLIMDLGGDFDQISQYFTRRLILPEDSQNHSLFDNYKNLDLSLQTLPKSWSMIIGTDPRSREKLVEFLDILRFNPDFSRKMKTALEFYPNALKEDLDFFLSIFNIKNKFIKKRFLDKILSLAQKNYLEKKSLTSTISTFSTDKVKLPLNPYRFLRYLVGVSSYLGNQAVLNTIIELEGKSGTGNTEEQEKFFWAMIELLDYEFSFSQDSFKNFNLEDRIEILYRMGLLAKLHSLPSHLEGNLLDLTEEYLINVLSKLTNIDVLKIKEQSRTGKINVSLMLTLWSSWEKLENEDLLIYAKNIFQSIIEEEYNDFRLAQKDIGEEFSEKYWRSFNQGNVSVIEKINTTQENTYEALYRQIYEANFTSTALSELEGESTTKGLKSYSKLKDIDEKERFREEVKQERDSQLENIRKNEKNASDEEKLELKKTRYLLDWIDLNLIFDKKEWLKNEEDRNKALKILKTKMGLYKRRGKESVFEKLLKIHNNIKSAKDLMLRNIIILDTADPFFIMKMGYLDPFMSNCFNPYGNPTFNQFIVSALGSKNMRLLVVLTSEGMPLAVSMYKIKKQESKPVIFLETGLTKVGYDFVPEMLSFLHEKSLRLPKTDGHKTPVFYQGKGKDLVEGIGAYTGLEYVEPVFSLRNAKKYKHQGILYKHLKKSPEITLIPLSENIITNKIPKFLSQIQGIGTSNKDIAQYISELKEGKVDIVVDVRENPVSRYYPQYNKVPFKNALADQGIDYLFLGDFLGNPKDINGDRLLNGFIMHQEGALYNQGVQKVQKLLSEGKTIALTCSEGQEKDCHRKYILNDLRKKNIEINCIDKVKLIMFP